MAKINRLIRKRKSNINLKVTIEIKWFTQNFKFMSLKSSSHFLSLNFQTCWNLKTRGLRVKLRADFLLFLFWDAFGWTKIQSLIKSRRNRKWKIPHTFLERRTLCFSSYKNRQLKMMSWGSWMKTSTFFCNACFVRRKIFWHLFYLNVQCVKFHDRRARKNWLLC